MFDAYEPTIENVKSNTVLLEAITGDMNRVRETIVTLTLIGVVINLIIAIILPEDQLQGAIPRLVLLMMSLLLLGTPLWFIKKHEELCLRGNLLVRRITDFSQYQQFREINNDENTLRDFTVFKEGMMRNVLYDNFHVKHFPLLKSSTAYVKINFFAFAVVILAMFVQYGNV